MTITITVTLDVDPLDYRPDYRKVGDREKQLRGLFESDDFRDAVEDAVNVACDDTTGVEPADTSVDVKVQS